MTVTISGQECELAGGVIETTQTVGTGSYVLDGAASIEGTTYRTFVGAVGNGTSVPYVVRFGNEFEEGVGTITAGAPSTLSRDQVTASSNSDNPVSWGGGLKAIFLDATSPLLDQIRPIEQLRGKLVWGGTSTGTANAQTISLTPAVTSLEAGDRLVFVAGAALTNTDAMTVSVNGGSAISLRHLNGADLSPHTVFAGSIVEAVFNGTNLRLTTMRSPGILYGPTDLSGGGISDVPYTDLPPGTRRITFDIGGVSGTGTAPFLLQIGESSGGFHTTGYAGAVGDGSVVTTGIPINNVPAAGDVFYGQIIATLANPAAGYWTFSGAIVNSVGQCRAAGGAKSIGAAITDRIRIITADAFDAGFVSAWVE